jgi:nitroreductase / dihydropteridine reductase
MNIINYFKWRYATKKFDSTKKLSDQQLSFLLEATNLAPSSYGLQPFSIIVVENSLLRDKLRAVSYDQSQVSEASHLLVFAAKSNLSVADIEAYIERIVNVRNVSIESMKDYKQTMSNSITSKTPEALLQWASRQIYISLGFLLAAAATDKIDVCPMEGFQKEKYDEILGLTQKGLTSVVIAAIGFRSENDSYQFKPKVRKSLEELVTFYT